MTRAEGAFTVDHSQATPGDWPDGVLSHSRLSKTFTGDLSGSSVVEAIMLKVDGEGPSAYVGIERFDCVLGGRAGTFLLMHSATASGDEHAGAWTIVPESGTGELAEIRGSGEILANHEFVLEYELSS